MIADLVADGRFDVQLATWLQAEADQVEGAAGDPAIVGHPGDGGEAHAGHPADHIQDLGHRGDLGNEIDVLGQQVRGDWSRGEGAHRVARTVPCRGGGEDGERQQAEASSTEAGGLRHRPCAASIASIQAKRVTGCPPVWDGLLRLLPEAATGIAARPGFQRLPASGGRRSAQGWARSSCAANASRVPSSPKRAAKWLPRGRPLGVHQSGTDMAG